MHLLEMAKTTWNVFVTGDNGRVAEESLRNELRVYLGLCQEILGIFGREGDKKGGPLEEIRTLHGLLESG